ncbi:MAG TPA: alpha/beta fold hydrolase [Thermoanaerobaculia bacterium]|nr:alpha/beta fold hydrolase [Thermoanaerobaculia bacterium]
MHRRSRVCARDRLALVVLAIAAVAALAHCSTPFSTTDRTRRGYLRANASTLGAPPRPVIVIAGFGVTRLVDPRTQQHVWGTPRAMWHTEYEDDLDLDPHDRLVASGWVGSRGPINTGWQLAIGLRKYGGYTLDRDLHPFYYDWRRSARENAERLRRFVEQVRGEGNVDLVTHSAGALVALAYLDERAPVQNLVMVAPPRHGTVEAFRIFVRPERFLRRTFGAEMVATWPSIFELLPENGRVFVDERGHALERDLWDASTWPLDVRAQLASARAFRDAVRAKPIPPHVRVTALAGDCVPTARRILARADGTYAFYPRDLREHERSLQHILFEPGDGTLGRSSVGEATFLCDGHQGIAADPHVHRAVIRTLRE